jgi:tetratricopeptide (TPR) repeat protein
MIRSIAITGLLFMLISFTGVPPGWTQQDLKLDQYSSQVEQYWKKKILRNPRDGKAYYHLGRYYEFTHRIQLAAGSYHQATLINPGWPQAFFYLGKAYRELRRFQEAAVALKRAVLLKSDYARAYHFLGLVMIDLGRYEEAAQALVNAYTYDPGWAETYYDNTTYGMQYELGMDKEINLRLIKYIYPVNQHLARILYNNWSRGNAAMKEYWQTVAGAELPADKGYHQGPIPGYREPQDVGYQKAQDLGFQRRANEPSAPE